MAVAIMVVGWLIASTSSAGAVDVPPVAPSPTSTAVSPDAPDPHPPVGGIGPDGQPVGGAQLQSRGLVVPAGAPAVPVSVNAAAWALVDLDSGAVLAGRDVHGRYQPASILKLLTAATLIPALPGDETVTASPAAVHTECACTGLLAGGTYTVDNLFSGLLLVSGNDAAVALAEAYGGVDKTVAAMNAKAISLGAYDTYVQTPSGLDGWQQLTSAYDMSLFLRAAMNESRFVSYDEQPTALIPAQHVNGVALDPVALVNQTENFLTQVPGALAAKIGYTDAAQHTYVAAAERNGRRLGVVLLRGQNYPVGQWQQAAQLLDWGYSLPATTEPVGQLAPPVIAVRAAASSAPAPSAAAASRHPVSAGQRTGSPQWGWALVGVLGLAALLATAELFRRQRRRPEVSAPGTGVGS